MKRPLHSAATDAPVARADSRLAGIPVISYDEDDDRPRREDLTYGETIFNRGVVPLPRFIHSPQEDAEDLVGGLAQVLPIASQCFSVGLTPSPVAASAVRLGEAHPRFQALTHSRRDCTESPADRRVLSPALCARGSLANEAPGSVRQHGRAEVD